MIFVDHMKGLLMQEETSSLYDVPHLKSVGVKSCLGTHMLFSWPHLPLSGLVLSWLPYVLGMVEGPYSCNFVLKG